MEYYWTKLNNYKQRQKLWRRHWFEPVNPEKTYQKPLKGGKIGNLSRARHNSSPDWTSKLGKLHTHGLRYCQQIVTRILNVSSLNWSFLRLGIKTEIRSDEITTSLSIMFCSSSMRKSQRILQGAQTRSELKLKSLCYCSAQLSFALS